MSLIKAQKIIILDTKKLHNPLLNGYVASTLRALENKGIMKTVDFGYSQFYQLTEKGTKTKQRLEKEF
ncbi:MAG TPA: hypothetical protein VMZ91_08065 [Candidatus Paceibacterota bacterium]|nr:hypothetical protein [Candidatus Paceibacterota bacterium]